MVRCTRRGKRIYQHDHVILRILNSHRCARRSDCNAGRHRGRSRLHLRRSLSSASPNHKRLTPTLGLRLNAIERAPRAKKQSRAILTAPMKISYHIGYQHLAEKYPVEVIDPNTARRRDIDIAIRVGLQTIRQIRSARSRECPRQQTRTTKGI
jgi:hypothetical protein